MAYGFTVTQDQKQTDFTARSFVCNATVTVTTGTYPTGGIGPLAIAALYGIGVTNATPIHSEQSSIGSPPSGYVYQYDVQTDKLRCFVTGAAAGDALQELSGTIDGDVIDVQQVFSRP